MTFEEWWGDYPIRYVGNDSRIGAMNQKLNDAARAAWEAATTAERKRCKAMVNSCRDLDQCTDGGVNDDQRREYAEAVEMTVNVALNRIDHGDKQENERAKRG